MTDALHGPEPLDDAGDLRPARSFAESAAEAFARADRALRRGRPTEARRFLAIAECYEIMIARAERRDRTASEAPATDAAPPEPAAESARTAPKAHEMHDVRGEDEQPSRCDGRWPASRVSDAALEDLRALWRRLRTPPPP